MSPITYSIQPLLQTNGQCNNLLRGHTADCTNLKCFFLSIFIDSVAAAGCSRPSSSRCVGQTSVRVPALAHLIQQRLVMSQRGRLSR